MSSQNGVNANFSGDRKSTASVGSVNNIYDIAGNMYEWTGETFSTNYRLVHGSVYYTFSTDWFAGYRVLGHPTSSNGTDGSRMTLYINII